VRTECKILNRKPEGVSPHAKPGHTQEGDIEMDLKVTGNILTRGFFIF
jgi:hypothetical protein